MHQMKTKIEAWVGIIFDRFNPYIGPNIQIDIFQIVSIITNIISEWEKIFIMISEITTILIFDNKTFWTPILSAIVAPDLEPITLGTLRIVKINAIVCSSTFWIEKIKGVINVVTAEKVINANTVTVNDNEIFLFFNIFICSFIDGEFCEAFSWKVTIIKT